MPMIEPHGDPETIETHWYAFDAGDPTNAQYASVQYARHKDELIYWLTARGQSVEVTRANLEELRTALDSLLEVK